MSGGPSRAAGDERHHLAVDQRPDWLAGWCRRELGAAPAHLLLRVSCVSKVVAMRLEDGREVVVKARPDERGRAWACVAAQDALARRGFPCARPLSPVTLVGGLAVHAEQWRPGGEIAAGDDPAADALAARRALPYELEDAARRVRRRMALARLPCVLGQAAWERRTSGGGERSPTPCTTGTASRGCRRRRSPGSPQGRSRERGRVHPRPAR